MLEKHGPEAEKNKYRLLLESLPDAFCYCQVVTDAAGKPLDYIFLSVSDTFTEMIGLARNKVVGKKVTEVYPGIENNHNWIDTFGQVALMGKKIHFEQYFKSENLWYGITAYSKEPGYFAAVFRDITTFKRTEEALRESETKYRELVENLNEVLYILDEEARIIYISPNIERISGYTHSELAGKRFTEFVHPDDLEGRLEQFLKILSGIDEASEYRFVTKKGDITWVRTSARPLFKEGRVVGIQGVLMNITERKQAEERIWHMSFHDSLTGLYNRYFLKEEMKRLDTVGQLPVSIIMADLNGLKLVNDAYGHSAGDEVLRRTAHILKSSCRKKDVIVRWGGDEFVILLPQTMPQEAEAICQRIVDSCHKTHTERIPISIALGVAFKDSTRKKLAEILKKAEKDMYKQKLAEYRSTRNIVLSAMFKTLAEKSFESNIHIKRMQKMALKIGEKIGLPDSELERLTALISLHDLGKINIPEKLLTKKETLSAREKETIKKHPENGYRIARATKEFAHVAEDILAHHERWDGSGYPQGLKGKEIPLLARITAIVDAYEVMTSGRPYKKATSPSDALAELKRCAGTQFDPELVEIFIGVWKEAEI